MGYGADADNHPPQISFFVRASSTIASFDLRIIIANK